MQGWIRLPRNIQETKVYNSIYDFKLFLHLLLVAQHTDTIYEDEIVKRGCLSSSYKELSKQTGLKEQEVFDAIARLIDWKEIKVDNEMGKLRISILKYEKYQDKDMEQGWVKIYRNIVDWVWYKNVNTLYVFLYLIVNVNYRDSCRNNSIVLEGSCVTSVREITEVTCLSCKEVRNALENIKSSNNITWKRCGRYTIYSVVNYSKWQSSNVYEQEKEDNIVDFNPKGKQNDRKSNEGQTEGKQNCVNYVKKGKRRANTNYNNKYNGFNNGYNMRATRNMINNYQNSTSKEVIDEFQRLFMLEVNS